MIVAEVPVGDIATFEAAVYAANLNGSNGYVVKFTLPSAPEGECWELVADTNMPDLPELQPTGSRFDIGHVYEVTARSALVFELI